jgi:hypothetical protein
MEIKQIKTNQRSGSLVSRGRKRNGHTGQLCINPVLQTLIGILQGACA